MYSFMTVLFAKVLLFRIAILDHSHTVVIWYFGLINSVIILSTIVE